MFKHIKSSILLILIVSIFVGCGATTKQGTENKNTTDEIVENKNATITFGVTPWSSTVPPTQIAKKILQDMGYTVKEISADAGGVYAGLSTGDIDVFMDAWLPDMHKNYMKKFGTNIDDVSVSYPNGELGWVVPTYVKDVNSIEDIKGKESQFGGKIYGIEEGAGMTMTSKEMIKAYGLDLQYVASSEGGMLAQASKLIKDKKPVIFLGWRPHPMFVNYDLKVLKDPKGYFKASEVHVLTHKGLKNKAPEAYAFLSKWNIDVEDIEKMIVEIDGGKAPEDVAAEWIKQHKDKVNAMTGK
ncbi:glycine betaine ABC transporter substrate-binding protein [Clostridium brassicae]|uniref:Glycine betaine ABC transporter substrate-binding protein n=1 Tax=Clostridium brassicae TaxID=2999072 RepID=A0ABT4D758_9CLOT|nr:glycine betaine ABC transporter substrate-binding protein [Clostridium brassicae]MCY6958108.1 glycine betaine ABC transporter substrate-binding protein [Clostridium brassicae]